MCAKIKHDKEIISRRLIFWDGLRNIKMLLPLESEAGSASRLWSPLCWPEPQSRTETGITTIMALGFYFSAFPTDSFNSNTKRNNFITCHLKNSHLHPGVVSVRNDLSGNTTASVCLFRATSCQHSRPCRQTEFHLDFFFPDNTG